MKKTWKTAAVCVIAAMAWAGAGGARAARAMDVIIEKDAAPRVEFGAQRVADALAAAGAGGKVVKGASNSSQPYIIVGTADKGGIGELQKAGALTIKDGEEKPQGFVLTSMQGGRVAVAGADDSGSLYGCLELAKRITEAKKVPADLHFVDAPQMVMRGPCIGMQKTYRLPGRGDYEYPYTPELFPFFYDKAYWTEYLDFLVSMRMNTVYLWNGHPFASLVKVPGYEYAVEVPDDVFQKNQEMFKYIVQEADKRGIFVMQMFYNIYVSKTFAQKNGLSKDTFASSTPLIADYNRKSIAAFVKTYPDAGLMVCLGEALKGEDEQMKWLTEVIIPGVKDGIAEAGLKEEIPILLRAHAMPARTLMPAAVKIYKNLYTETKYNGESLTTWQPRGADADMQQMLAHLGSTPLTNVHVLSNLEPFRYGAQRFIKLCVQAAEDTNGVRGVHLYPLFYWNWPNSPDKTAIPIKQIDRDWIWFEAWARYAWNSRIDETTDHAYWVKRIGDMYGSPEAGEKILAAYNDSGECAPRLIRRFGITEGNRQTLSLGMTLDQLAYPRGYYPILWESWAPLGERMHDVPNVQGFNTLGYVNKEWQHMPHVGETPPDVIKAVLDYSQKAVDEINAAAPFVTKNKEEFARLQNDMKCIHAMSENYGAKANAAMCELRYDLSHDLSDLAKSDEYLAQSLTYFRELTDLTKDTYQWANSLHTSHRQIPNVAGGDPPGGGQAANTHWTQLLPVYEKEYEDYHFRVSSLLKAQQAKQGAGAGAAAAALPQAKITVRTPGAETYQIAPGAKVFTDSDAAIVTVAPELKGQTGIRFSQKAMGTGGKLELESDVPVKILVGYVKADGKQWLQVPNLDADSAFAETIDPIPAITNAAKISGLPGLDIRVMKVDKGRHELDMHGSGAFVVLGVIPADTKITAHDAKEGN